MHRITAALVAVATAMTLTACATTGPADPEPSAAPARATETDVDAEPTEPGHADERSAPEPTPEHGAYGSDPLLDALYDRCDGGELMACDELFWEAPLRSEYEDFARERGAGVTEADALAYVWSTMDAEEREALCWETDKLGLDEAYEAFAWGYGDDPPTQDQFSEFIETHCLSQP